MSAPLNGGLYLLASRALSGRQIWPMERTMVKAQLAGESAADGLFKWLAAAWAVALVPLTVGQVLVRGVRIFLILRACRG